MLNGTKMFAGNYTVWAEAAGYLSNVSQYFYVYGGINLTFRYSILDPNATYRYGQPIQVDVLIDSYGPESRTLMNNSYNTRVNATFTNPNGDITAINLNRT